MPGRHAIFIDAGFLLASVGELLHDRVDRSRIQCRYETLIPAITERTTELSGRELLRVYWYDGAVNKVPTPDQKRVGLLSDVKLRLGRIVAGHQKGVDSLIVLDLLRLAATGNVDVIYLFSGDDDLTEGVREAQAAGVRVILLGAATATPRQSEAIALEADGVTLWDADFWSAHVELSSEGASERAGSSAASSTDAVRTFERVGYAFAARWIQETGPEAAGRVRRSRPRIPSDVDARLLWDTSAGRDLSEAERVALRDGFWRAFDEAEQGIAPSLSDLDDEDADLDDDEYDEDFDDEDDDDDDLPEAGDADDEYDEDEDDDDEFEDDDDFDDEVATTGNGSEPAAVASS